jgi:hypothetical protein
MANYICRPMVNVPDYLVASVTVPAGQTIYAGSVVNLATLDTSISGNFSVYAAATPVTATLGVQMGLVINGGWELLSDGRRPEGQPDYTQYSYAAGEVITVVVLAPKIRFEISDDAVTASGTPAVGEFLYPVNNSWKLTDGASVPSGTFSSLKILAKKYFRLGGLYGGQFASTMVAVAQNPTA